MEYRLRKTDLTDRNDGDFKEPLEKRILMISFLYPPPKSVGTIRVEKFVKYLPEFGWKPTVLTRQLPKGERPATGEGASAAKVIRARYFDLYSGIQRLFKLNPKVDTMEQLLRAEDESGSFGSKLKRRLVGFAAGVAKNWVAIPDKEVPWLPFAFFSAWREMRGGSYSVIYSTNPPTSHIIAFLLKKASGLPWIADYRDPWSLYMLLREGKIRIAVEKWLERKVIGKADYITAVSNTLLELQSEVASEGAGMAVITNGFDPEEFESIDVEPRTDTFILTYAGGLYGFARDPRPLIAVLDRLADEGVISEGDLRVRFYSDCRYELEKLQERINNRWLIEIDGMIDHREVLVKQKESAVLVNLMIEDPIAKLGHGSKIFEYLGAGRPVLVWSPSGGPVEELMEETGGGEVARDESDLRRILEKWIMEFKETGSLSIPRNEGKIEKYTRRNQARRLAGILDGMLMTADEESESRVS